jgi:hypothetical protein
MLKETFQKRLADGEHSAVLISQEYHAHATDETKDYIALKFLVDGEVTYSRNFFERNMTIAISHIREQLKREYENIIPLNLLNELITNKTPLKIWIATEIKLTDSGPQRYQNINFLAPLVVPEDTTETDASDEILNK